MAVWLFAWGVGVLMTRAITGGDWGWAGWGAIGLIPAIGLGIWLAERKMPSKLKIRAALDNHSGCGGLLLIENEEGSKEWRESTPRVVQPRIHWNSRRATVMATAGAIFAALGFLAPDGWFVAQVSGQRLHIQGQADLIQKQIEAMEQENILPARDAEALLQKLEQIKSQASAREPEKTYSALDSLAQKLKQKAGETAEESMRQMETMNQTQALADGLMAATKAKDAPMTPGSPTEAESQAMISPLSDELLRSLMKLDPKALEEARGKKDPIKSLKSLKDLKEEGKFKAEMLKAIKEAMDKASKISPEAAKELQDLIEKAAEMSEKELSEKLEQVKESAKLTDEQTRKLQKALSRTPALSTEQMKKLTEAMKDLQAQTLSEQEFKELLDQFKEAEAANSEDQRNLSEALKQASEMSAEQKKALEKAIQEALKLDPKQMEELKKALENAGKMSDKEMKEAADKLAEQMKLSPEQMRMMSKAMKNGPMLTDEQLEELKEALKELKEQEAPEMTEDDLKELMKALAESQALSDEDLVKLIRVLQNAQKLPGELQKELEGVLREGLDLTKAESEEWRLGVAKSLILEEGLLQDMGRELGMILGLETDALDLIDEALKGSPDVTQEQLIQLLEDLLKLKNKTLTNEQFQQMLDQLKNGKQLTPEQLKELMKLMAKAKLGMGQSGMKMGAMGLLDAQSMQKMLSIAKMNPKMLAKALAQCKNPGQLALALQQLSNGKPGKGGVTRGPGHAPITWSQDTKQSKEDGAKLTTLPQGGANPGESEVQGVQLVAPKVEKAGPDAGGALNNAKSGGGSANTQGLLPAHRGAVKRFFDRKVEPAGK